MDVWNDIISIIVSNGVFAILFVFLFLFQLKDSAKREANYQQTIRKLSDNLQTLEEVKEDIIEIKELLREDDT